MARRSGPLLGCTVAASDADPFPDGGLTVAHATLLEACHAQALWVVTVIVRLTAVGWEVARRRHVETARRGRLDDAGGLFGNAERPATFDGVAIGGDPEQDVAVALPGRAGSELNPRGLARGGPRNSRATVTATVPVPPAAPKLAEGADSVA